MINSMVNATGFYVPLYSLMYFASALALLVLISVPASAELVPGTSLDTYDYFKLTLPGQFLPLTDRRKLEHLPNKYRHYWRLHPDGFGRVRLTCLWRGTRLKLGIRKTDSKLRLQLNDNIDQLWTIIHKGGRQYQFQSYWKPSKYLDLNTMTATESSQDHIRVKVEPIESLFFEYRLYQEMQTGVRWLMKTIDDALFVANEKSTYTDDYSWMLFKQTDGSYKICSTMYGKQKAIGLYTDPNNNFVLKLIWSWKPYTKWLINGSYKKFTIYNKQRSIYYIKFLNSKDRNWSRESFKS